MAGNEIMTFRHQQLVFFVILMFCMCESTAIRVSVWKRRFTWIPVEQRKGVLMCITHCVKNLNVDSVHVTKQTDDKSCKCLELNGKTEKVKKQGYLYVLNRPEKTMVATIANQLKCRNHVLFLFASEHGWSKVNVHLTTDEGDLFIGLYDVQFEIYALSIDIPTNQVFHGGKTIKRGTLTFEDFMDILINGLDHYTVGLALDVDKNILYLVQKEHVRYSFDILDLDTGKKRSHAHVEMTTYGDAVIKVKHTMVYYISKGHTLKSFDFASNKTKHVTKLSGTRHHFIVFRNQLLHCQKFKSRFTLLNLKTGSDNTFDSYVSSCAAMGRTEKDELVFVFMDHVLMTDMKGKWIRQIDFRHQTRMFKGFFFLEPYVVL